MRTFHKTLLTCVLGISGLLLIADFARALTVENISLQRLTTESNLIVYGRIESSYSQWEGKTIYTYTTLRVNESLKGEGGSLVTVKQLGGTVGETGLEVPGTPKLIAGEDVVLFLTRWQDQYWIHSIVLGKFSVITTAGETFAYNDLTNIGLIDPVTKREVTAQDAKQNNFPLQSFLATVRTYVQNQ